MKNDTDYGNILTDVIYERNGGTGMNKGETTEGFGSDELIGDLITI